VLFTAVPVSVPGQAAALLVLGMADTDAGECAATAGKLAGEIGGLFAPEA
jgi:hypothetical protein